MGFKLSTHNGKVTIKNRRTGQHRTFRIRTEKWRDGSTHRTVGLLTGPDNTGDYRNFGFVSDNGQIKVWKKFASQPAFVTYAKMLMAPSVYMAKGAEYMAEGHCRRCNRLLTDPDSIENGIGPVCAEKGGQ